MSHTGRMATLLLFTLSILFMLVSMQSTAQTTPDPLLLEQIAKIKVIDNHSHMSPATVAQGTKKEPANLLGTPPFPYPVNLRFDNPHWLGAWRDLYGYRHTDMKAEHLSVLFKEKQRIKREQGENYPNWILDKLGIDRALVSMPNLGLGQAPPRFYLVKKADGLMTPFSGNPPAKGDIQPAATLEAYVQGIVAPAMRSFKEEGALAIKFTIAYRRPLDFKPASRTEAAPIYEQLLNKEDVPIAHQHRLADFLFRYIVQEAGRLGLAVHIHTGIGASPYFNISGSNPLLLEPTLNDPDMRDTRFVIIHGGWPYERETGVMLIKPNVYVDFSAQTFLRSPRALSKTLREWLEWYPEKVLFGTDAASVSPLSNWEEYAWLSMTTARSALAMALTDMMNDGQITRDRALDLAEMVLRTNAINLYGFE